jgi:quercetin dioxygenase-like cupin family protein
MARQGDVIENPRRKEQVRFVETAIETNGARMVAEVTAQPTEVGPPVHMHPAQTETFEVERGTLTYVLGRAQPRTAGPGEVVVVPPGVSHTWWNSGPSTLHMVGRLEPAGRFQTFIETIYGLIRDGKVNARGIPVPLQMAVIAWEFRKDVVFTAIPAPARLVVLPVVAAIGRLRGYRPWYPEYTDSEISAANAAGPST